MGARRLWKNVVGPAQQSSRLHREPDALTLAPPRSHVAGLLRDTFPWANPQLVLVGLGAVEVALGLGLIVFRRGVVVPLAMAMHLCGTFITFVILPERMIQHGNPLLLSMDAEFVGKNLVLIAALVALVGTQNSTAASAREG